MLQLFEQGRRIDPITLQEALREAGDIDLIESAAYIGSLFDQLPRFANIEHYTRIVKDKSILRQLIAASKQIIASCFDDEEEVKDIIHSAERMIVTISAEHKKGMPSLKLLQELRRRA